MGHFVTQVHGYLTHNLNEIQSIKTDHYGVHIMAAEGTNGRPLGFPNDTNIYFDRASAVRRDGNLPPMFLCMPMVKPQGLTRSSGPFGKTSSQIRAGTQSMIMAHPLWKSARPEQLRISKEIELLCVVKSQKPGSQD